MIMENVGSFLINPVSDSGRNPPTGPSRTRPISRDWRVDRIHCHLLGQAFADVILDPKRHPLRVSRPWQVWTELITVTICHQANWDKLHSTVVELAAADLSQIDPKRLLQISASDFRRMFGAAYDTDRIRSGEGARLLR